MLSSINTSKVGATGPTLALLVPLLEPINFTGSGSVGPINNPTGPTAPTGPSTVLTTPFVERIEFTGSGPCGPTGPTIPEHPINLIHPLVSQVTAPTNNTGGSTDVYEDYAVVDGAQIITLARPQLYAGQKLYVNGLLQHRNSYTLNNNVLTLPSELEIMIGDLITFEYS